VTVLVVVRVSQYGHLNVVKALLATKASVDSLAATGHTPLHIAAQACDRQPVVVPALIAHSLDMT